MRKPIFNFLFIAALAFAGSFTISGCGHSSNDSQAEEEATEEVHEHEADTHEHEGESTDEINEEVVYACPMHPEETGKEGDTCSICKMALVKVEKETETEEAKN